MYAIANALEGMSRAEAARLAGMERQALRDVVVRYNAEGLGGLCDRPKGRPPRRLSAGEEAALAAAILKGPDPDRDGVCAWTRADLCAWLAARFGKTYHPSSMTRVPEQQVAPIVDHFKSAEGAKSYFLIGSDYAFGRGMLEFTRDYIGQTGGKVVGEEYLPMDGTDWTPIISKLKSSGADALITSTSGLRFATFTQPR